MSPLLGSGIGVEGLSPLLLRCFLAASLHRSPQNNCFSRLRATTWPQRLHGKVSRHSVAPKKAPRRGPALLEISRQLRACTHKSRCRQTLRYPLSGKAVVEWCCEESPRLTQSGQSELNPSSRSDSAAQGVRRSQRSLPSGNHGEYEVLVVFKARKDDACHVKTDND